MSTKKTLCFVKEESNMPGSELLSQFPMMDPSMFGGAEQMRGMQGLVDGSGGNPMDMMAPMMSQFGGMPSF